MSGPYAYTPAIWPSVLTVLVLIALSVYAGRRRSAPGTLPFAIACLFDVLWMAGYALVIAAMDTAKIFWLKFGSVWQLFAATAVACFVLEYAWPGRWLTRRNLALLSIPPLLTMGLILTDNLHHLMWRGFVVDGLGVKELFGPAARVAVAYGVGLGLVDLVVFGWLFLRSPQHRWPVVLMLSGQMVARVAYVAHIGKIIQSELPLNVLGIAFQFAMYAIALFGFRLFDPVALARLTLIEQLSDGMLVLDDQGRVASLNPAAERIFGLTARQVKDKPVREVLPAYPEELQPVTSGTEIEFSLPASGGVSHYGLVISLLNDWRGQQVGRLLLLRDVTGQKRAQAQLVEQQRVVATLQERERLGRELHDNLGQVLGYVKMKVQIAREALAEEEKTVVDRHLAQLEGVVQEAHTDVRDYLLGLDARPPAETAFFSALREYLRRFGETYPIETDLRVSPEMAGCALSPTVQVQLLRIIQEALTNTRKHAVARRVCVSACKANGRAQIVIEDDGRGFDPDRAAQGLGQHYGLGFMRERAAEVGGSVEVDSAPSQGTRVTVEVPVKD